MKNLLLAVVLCFTAALYGQAPAGRTDYRIGSDDLLEIRVFQIPSLDTTTRVAASGSISLQLVGSIHAAGLSERELEKAIETALGNQGLVNDPHVTVLIREYGSQPVSIVGAVKLPGIYQVKGQKFLLDMLAQAQGLSADAGDTIQVIRAPKQGAAPSLSELIAINIEDLLERGQTQLNIPIQAYDAINVLPAQKVSVTGAVKLPGIYPLKGQKFLMDALAQAQGLSVDAGDTIQVIRGGKSAEGATTSTHEVIAISVEGLFERGQTQLNIPIFSRDAINVLPAQKVSITGAVKLPGIYPLKGQKFLMDALALAQGLSETAGDTIQVIRGVQGTEGAAESTTRVIAIDIEDLFERGQTRLNIPILPYDAINVLPAQKVSVTGAVKLPGIYPLKGRKNLMDALALAQGLSETAGDIIQVIREAQGGEGASGAGAQVIAIDTEDLFEHGQTQLNIPIFAYDAINVLPVQKVSITGAVKLPGIYPLKGKKNLLDALALAQGLTETAGDTIQVIRTPISEPGSATPAASPQVIAIRIEDLVDREQTQLNIPIFPRDVINVLRARSVFVVGEVTHPDEILLRNGKNLTVIQAIGRSNGFTREARKNGCVIIRFGEDGTRKEIAVDVQKSLKGEAADIEMLPNDILFVPADRVKATLNRSLDAAIAIVTGRVVYSLPGG